MHFSVAVFSKRRSDVGDMLEPFNECSEANYQFVAEDTVENIRRKWQESNRADTLSFNEYVENYCGCHFSDDHTQVGYNTNPNARWDWYAIGGRYADLLTLKEGRKGYRGERSWTNKDEPLVDGKCDIAKVKDVAIGKEVCPADRDKATISGGTVSWKTSSVLTRILSIAHFGGASITLTSTRTRRPTFACNAACIPTRSLRLMVNGCAATVWR